MELRQLADSFVPAPPKDAFWLAFTIAQIFQKALLGVRVMGICKTFRVLRAIILQVAVAAAWKGQGLGGAPLRMKSLWRSKEGANWQNRSFFGSFGCFWFGFGFGSRDHDGFCRVCFLFPINICFEKSLAVQDFYQARG